MKMDSRRLAGLCLAALCLIAWGADSAWAQQAGPARSQGQEIYVAAYCKVYYGLKGQSFPLVTTLLFHNTDPENPLEITSASYYNHEGALVAECLEQPVKLAPLGAWEYLVKKPVETGSSGSCFVVRWQSQAKISPPIVESVMISSTGQQGISFSSTGRVIKELKH